MELTPIEGGAAAIVFGTFAYLVKVVVNDIRHDMHVMKGLLEEIRDLLKR